MTGALLAAAVFPFLFLFFSVLVLRRPADVDEGFFLAFGKSIFVHRRAIYLDFFSPQMPLLPYVYGALMSVFGYKWVVARLFCAFLASTIGAMLCSHAFERTRSQIFAISVAVIYCFSPFIFIWFTCARIPALATFFLLASVSLLPPMTTRASALTCLISGLLLGLSVDTRLYIVAVVPVLAFHVSRVEKERPRRAVLYFLGGVAIALAINLPFLVASPMKYLWGIIGIHAAKTPQGLIGNFSQKLDVLLQLLFDYPALRPTLYLCYLGVFVAYLAKQLLRRIPLSGWNPAFYVAGTIFLVSLLPTPTFGRYFCVPVPFFMLLAIDLFGSLLELLRFHHARRAAVGIVALGALLFAFMGGGKIDFYIFKGNNLGGSMPTEGGKEDWNLENVQEVSRAIDRLMAPDAAVLSLWPGYLLESHVRIMPRTDNMTLLELEDSLSERTLALSQTITDAEIREGIRAKTIDLLVYGNSIAPQVSEYKTLLMENGYVVAEKVGGISLFLSPEYRKRASATHNP
jgi:4-amino-4-deoxy-L-arabinose transferase-like glycosyltransferase